MRRLLPLATTSFLAILMMAAAGAPAAAYGNPPGGPTQTYQLMFSFNCNNPAACAGMGGTGGFWGWAVLYSDGTGDAELTGCNHLVGGGGPGTAGAIHFHDDFTFDLSNTTELVTISETQTYVGRFRTTMTVPGSDTGIPLIPGHYTASDLFGFTPPPGVAIQIQVVKLR